MTILTRLAYPGLIAASLSFCVFALQHGWPVWAIGVVVVVVSAVVVEILERVIPYASAWSQNTGDLRTDIWHNVISSRACDLGAFFAVAVFAPVSTSLWPQDWPLAVQGLLALALVELPWYWCHRLEHQVPLFWRIHAVHHSAPRLYWWNLARSHPIDNAVSSAASIAFVALLGVGQEPLALVAAFSAAHGMMQHSNADLRTGWLDIVLNTPRVHRWHHSRLPAESNNNYGPTLTIWDWVFGTRWFDPDRIPPVEVGLHDERAFPADFLGQLKSPFDQDLWDR